MYAARKRRKPAQKGVKPTVPTEGAKSNPSKRHRDRLNSELDRLASLLPFPEDVVSSLDKLSILRLSVSFLRTKSFFSVALKNPLSNGMKKSSDHCHDSKTSGSVDGHIPEGELLLQALNGFILVVTAEGIVFFCSHTIQDYLGFHQTDVMHHSVFELIHTEDQQEFRSNLHWALNPPAGLGPPTDPSTDGESVSSTSSRLVSYNPDQLPPENSSFLERGFVCRFRCLLDNSSGFLALNIQGRLKFLHGQSRHQYDSEGSTPPQLALFAIATPLQPPAILEIRTRNMIFRTKHKLDFTPMACDAKGKIVLGYTEAELRVRGSGYQFIHAADMLHCAENHVRMMKTGESGLTVFRLLTKENRWKWVQANARLVYKNGKPDYIIATQRPLVDEEGGEHLRKRSMHLPFTFATGEAMLYQTGYPLHGFPDSFQGKAKGSKSKKGKLDKSSSDDLHPNSLLGAVMSQDESVYVCQPDTEPKMSYHSGLFSEQQGDSSGFGGLLNGDSWQIISNSETGRCNSRTSSYDPLLSTLDSLSLDEDETCTNSELFSALENLGLNAEDLELLLLDERMIQVELDPNHIPTLSDILTNNEILSYIHDSLETGTEGEEQGERVGLGSSTNPPNSTQSVAQQSQACLTPAVPPALPIIQLSQQMQQHISAGELVKAQTGQIQSQPETADTKTLTGIPNSHWVVTTQNPHHPNNHTHHHPHPVLKATQQNGEHKHLNSLLESSQQWQLQQDQHTVQLHSHEQINIQSALLPGFQSQPGVTTNESYIPNGHAAFPPNVDVSHTGYNITNTPHAGGTVVNGVTTPDACHYQRLVATTQPYQLQGHQKNQQQQQMLQQTQVPPSCPSHSSTLELEQLLGLSQQQHSLPSIEAYGMFSTTTQDSTRSKLENGCLFSATNTAYIRTCLMPNGNGVAAGDIPVSCTDGLSALQDPQKSGFFL
ncbi:aryl hydrocarbon receptor-like [Micropterus salmoides]|uniref:aryl hydrocarbon receptor-like n=1 Tax=Micropterus salmoides TaxID=27706 RepID=UPI0018EDC35C|nr:aryl hydrocarbon receptor-like [Micropterus salmoides]XP_038571373.1 aryl hydrocarbon receptor-like [Micropterus salmoides]